MSFSQLLLLIFRDTLSLQTRNSHLTSIIHLRHARARAQLRRCVCVCTVARHNTLILKIQSVVTRVSTVVVAAVLLNERLVSVGGRALMTYDDSGHKMIYDYK